LGVVSIADKIKKMKHRLRVLTAFKEKIYSASEVLDEEVRDCVCDCDCVCVCSREAYLCALLQEDDDVVVLETGAGPSAGPSARAAAGPLAPVTACMGCLNVSMSQCLMHG